MEDIEDLTRLAVSIYQDEASLKVIEDTPTNDLLLIYKRLEADDWAAKYVLSWGESYTAKQLLKSSFTHRRYAVVLLHACLYHYRLTNSTPAAALDTLMSSGDLIQTTLLEESFTSSDAMEHVFSSKDQHYLALLNPAPITIVKWKYCSSVSATLESVSGLCLTCSISDKDHVLAGLKALNPVISHTSTQVNCRLLLYSGDLTAGDIDGGLLILLTGIVKNREELLGRAVVCFEGIKLEVLEVRLL